MIPWIEYKLAYRPNDRPLKWQVLEYNTGEFRNSEWHGDVETWDLHAGFIWPHEAVDLVVKRNMELLNEYKEMQIVMASYLDAEIGILNKKPNESERMFWNFPKKLIRKLERMILKNA